MFGRFAPVAIALAALLVAWGLDLDNSCQAQIITQHRASPDLFYNYYVPPGSCGGVPAQLYLSPRPSPPVVGHTYVTYPPFMPHEFLYPHHRVYWRNHSSGSWTRTSITWHKSWF